MFMKNSFIVAALALLGGHSMVSALKPKYDDKLMASPFMTAVMVRDQFEDEEFVFDYNPIIDLEEIDELGGQAIAAQIAQFPALVNNGVG